jgi:ribosomal protein S18 acetylase RimI-like enzyme
MEPLQGLGIGTRLITSVETLARSHGYYQIQLAVERANLGALRLYERLGFSIFNQRVDIWSYVDQFGETQWVQEDVYGMQKAL